MATNSVTKRPTINEISPRISFYTFLNCPFAQRVHIPLEELRVHYEEIISQPEEGGRPQWYLEIVNPHSFLPVIKYSDSTVKPVAVAESDIITHFLCNAFPSLLLPTSPGSNRRFSAPVSPFSVKHVQAACLPPKPS